MLVTVLGKSALGGVERFCGGGTICGMILAEEGGCVLLCGGTCGVVVLLAADVSLFIVADTLLGFGVLLNIRNLSYDYKPSPSFEAVTKSPRASLKRETSKDNTFKALLGLWL